jgi:uncharacterized DUF497 family protein
MDGSGVDLMKHTDFITTYGIASQTTKHDPPLLLQLRGEVQPFAFKPEFCDGIPNYLLLWNDLNELVDEIELQPPYSDQREDVMHFAVAHAQALVDLLFVPMNESTVRVSSVRRATKKEEQSLRDEEASQTDQITSDSIESPSVRTASDL